MLRCATYNIGFGFDNRDLKSNIVRVWHYLFKNAAALQAGVRHINDALDMVLGFAPDILCLNEVFPAFSGEHIEARLRQAGYQTIIYGTELHNAPPLQIGTYLAVKWPGKQIPVTPPYSDHLFTGSGWCAMEVPGKDLVIYAIHPSLLTPLRKIQMKFLRGEVARHQALGKKVMVIGDCNASLAVILGTYGFGKLGIAGTALPTNLVWRPWPLSHISYDDLDHVLFTPEFKLVHEETRVGFSDHKLLLCDINEA